MKTFIIAAASVLGICVGAAQAYAAGDAAAGEAKSATCAGCHGPQGNSAAPTFPKLSGQGAAYIAKQLHDFKRGARKNDMMAPMAMPLSDQDIADLAAYYAAQPVVVGSADPASVMLGEKLYRGGAATRGVAACMSCHGPAGAGNDAAKFPALSGQHAAYTGAQLSAFQSGTRTNDPNKMMGTVAGALTEDEIKAVSEYVAGLH
jgi:cytochrome c553